MISLLLIILLIVLIVGAFPRWPYNQAWGYYPVGGFGLVLIVILLILLLYPGLAWRY